MQKVKLNKHQSFKGTPQEGLEKLKFKKEKQEPKSKLLGGFKSTTNLHNKLDTPSSKPKVDMIIEGLKSKLQLQDSTKRSTKTFFKMSQPLSHRRIDVNKRQVRKKTSGLPVPVEKPKIINTPKAMV